MKMQVWISLGAIALGLAGCAEPTANRADATPVTFSGEPPPKDVPKLLDVTLGGANLEAPPAGLDLLKSGQTVWIQLSMPVGQLPSVRRGANWESLSPDCGHGVVNGLDEISMPTGYNHMILSVVPGRPDVHAANIAACDYAIPPEGSPEDTPQTQFRVTGCFTVNEVAIPTARELVLQPRTPEACGL